MKPFVFTALLLLAAACTGAVAMDAEAETLARGYKGGKDMPISDVATLMRLSERWCYNQQDMTCAWSDIYLDVTDIGAVYEVTSLWDPEREITLTDFGAFEEDRFICEVATRSGETLRARTVDGTEIGGRDLWDLKGEIATHFAADTQEPLCFDYTFAGLSIPDDTITLTQRTWRNDSTDPAEDAEVTIHFDPATAGALAIRW
jgi:hypothetical protein